MSRLRGLAQWLRVVAFRSRVEDELDEELRDHAARELERQLAHGATPEEAKRRAALRVGNVHAAKDHVRDARGGRLVADAMADLRVGLRGLRRNPGFTVAVVLSLSLGVAGATAISSVVHAVVLRSMPYPEADRLHFVRVWWDSFSAHLSPADLELLRAHGGPVGTVGAFYLPADGFTMTTAAGPEVVPGAYVTSDLVQVLRIVPVLGSGFSADNAASEVLISRDLWQRLFNVSPDAIGRSLTFDGRARTIVGVMPAGFALPGLPRGDVWIKGVWDPPTRRGPFYLMTILRTHSGTTAAAAAKELTSLVAPIMRERFGGNPNWGYGVRSIRDTVVGDSRQMLLTALAAAGLVLLIATLNVANLLLARGTVRVRELAVRAALGAERGRLARQLLTESALVGLIGGGLGLGLATGALNVVRSVAPTVLPRMHEVRIDGAVAAFAIALGVGAGLLAGVLPVLRMQWFVPAESLRDGGRSVGAGRRYAAMRRLLVAAEIALALTVLTGAVLLAKTLDRLESTDPGFRAGGLVSFRLALPRAAYGPERTRAFFDDLGAQLRSLPGTSSAAISSALPPNDVSTLNNFTVEGQTNERGGGVAEQVEVSAAYFDTLGIRLVRGRGFDGTEQPDSFRVAVVNETLANRQFGSLDVVGRRFKYGGPDSTAPWTTIIGVAADVPYERGLWGGAGQTIYTSFVQNTWTRSPFIVVKSATDASTLVPSVRDVVRRLDPALPLRDIRTMEERLRLSATAARLRSWLALSFAAIALTLAVTGIYGVMAYHVTQRNRENAIRRALGARESQIIGGVIASGLRLAAVGIAVGVFGALAGARSLGTVLYHVSVRDPAVLGAGVAVLTGAALLACLIPATRAARVDPVVILRDE
jgi:putative ABC transport system permease protein